MTDTAPRQDGVRTRRLARCPDCWLPVASCVCGSLPRIDTVTRVVLVMHHVETRRSSNTGRLAARVLGAPVLLRGLRDAAPRPPAPEGPRLVLFPGPGARVLSAGETRAPVTLVVPDGNWKQASHAAARDEAALGGELVTLPPGAPSRYRLRRRADAHKLCTYEAIARALALLEPAERAATIESEMMAALDLFVERTLALRGGIPAAGFDP